MTFLSRFPALSQPGTSACKNCSVHHRSGMMKQEKLLRRHFSGKINCQE